VRVNFFGWLTCTKLLERIVDHDQGQMGKENPSVSMSKNNCSFISHCDDGV
jgi:hypothetical protein